MLQCFKNKKNNNINVLSTIFCNIGDVSRMLQCYNENDSQLKSQRGKVF